MAGPDTIAQPPPQLRALYADHHGWLQAWLRKTLRCPFTAEDLAQDTFLRLLVRPWALDAGKNPRAYLTTIAKGLVVDHWRRAEIERAWVAAMMARPEAVQPSAEHVAIIVETLAEVDRILATLPDKPRSAFLLAPTRLAPTRVAKKSTPTESRVSNPRTTSVTQPICWKSPAQAASSMPANTSGRPGRAGRITPAKPTRTRITAST